MLVRLHNTCCFRTGRIELDGEVSVAGVQWDISIGQETYIGFGPSTHMRCELWKACRLFFR